MKMYTTMTKATFIDMAKKIFSGNIDINFVNEEIGGISIQNFDCWQEFFDCEDIDCSGLVVYKEDPYITLVDAIKSEDPYAKDAHNKLNRRVQFLKTYGFKYFG